MSSESPPELRNRGFGPLRTDAQIAPASAFTTVTSAPRRESPRSVHRCTTDCRNPAIPESSAGHGSHSRPIDRYDHTNFSVLRGGAVLEFYRYHGAHLIHRGCQESNSLSGYMAESAITHLPRYCLCASYRPLCILRFRSVTTAAATTRSMAAPIKKVMSTALV